MTKYESKPYVKEGDVTCNSDCERGDIEASSWPNAKNRRPSYMSLGYVLRRLPSERRSITALTATMMEEADIRSAETSGRSDHPSQW